MRDVPAILPLRLAEVGYAVSGEPLIEGLSFTLTAGSASVILGPNGAGKSLTLRLCHGLLAATRGTVEWLGPGARLAAGGRPGEGPGRRRLGTGHAMVFQRPVLLRRSVRANLPHALALGGLGRAERRQRADAVLAHFGLEALAGRPARALSGGEQQRLALARAWALQPQVLFLDEPTAFLDPGATRAIEAMIAAFQVAGTKIVMTTHDLGQARRIAGEILFLHRGRLLERAPADRFFAGPTTPEAAAFMRGDLVG